MPAAGSVHFDYYRLDMRNAQLWRGQQLVKLSPKALSVLDCLVNRARPVGDQRRTVRGRVARGGGE